MILPTLMLAAALGAEGEVVQEEGPTAEVGAVYAPALLPRGAMSVYALLGAPDVGGGYRQGFERFELEVRLWFNYLTVSGLLEVGGKIAVLQQGLLQLVPNLGLGLEADSGAR